MKKDGKADSTIETAVARLTRLTKLCNIDDSEQVRATLATLDWQNNTKHHVAQVYTYFLRYLGKTWTPPKYTKEHGLPFIPTEEEIDTLISAGSPRTATRLQILKETGARVGELDKLEWTHIDTERKTIYITAEKGSNSRLLPISNKLIAMLNNLPRRTDKVFTVNKENFRKTFECLRNRTAIKLDNPRLKKIHLHTFRHFKGTTEYHKTKDIIHVKTVLGHKRIESTMLYINIESALYLATSDEWTCKATTDDNEATQLIEAGFEYVMTTPSGLMQFRKRK
jgi:integrase